MSGAGRPRPSGIVLAGGAGRRMGRPKAPISLDGRPLVVMAAETLRSLCDYVVVVSRTDVALPVLPSGTHLAHDLPGPDAPLTGVVTGLAAVPDGDVFVIACDMPFAAPALRALATVPPGIAAVAAADGRPQPLCARYPRRQALLVGRALLDAGEERAMALPRAMGARQVEVPASALANLNTPDDLRRAALGMAGCAA